MTQSCSQDNPPTTTTAEEAAHGHVEKVVQAHATTPALEHVWQAVQEGVQAVLGRVVGAVQVLVQGAVVVAHLCVQGAVQAVAHVISDY